MMINRKKINQWFRVMCQNCLIKLLFYQHSLKTGLSVGDCEPGGEYGVTLRSAICLNNARMLTIL